MRRHLEPDKTVAEIVGAGRDYIKLNGKDRHVIGYLRGFLFSARRAKTPIKALSGGERNRVILAHLFTRPSNLLVLDEPTNDLDIETLEVLEEKLIEFEGTLIIVSHDRQFLDNVITSTLVFEEQGVIRRYPGAYSDWLTQGKHLIETDNPVENGQKGNNTRDRNKNRNVPGKLSYKFKLELEGLPRRIESLEDEIDALQKEISSPDFYSRDYNTVQSTLECLADKQGELERVLERWIELESL